MCGRFSLTTPLDALRALFDFPEDPSVVPRWNIAPSQPVLALRHDRAGRPRLGALRWGLVPAWARDASVGNRMINARSEGAAERPAFREAFVRRRCLIPADGFYEWQTQGKGPKQPFRLEFEGQRPFAFAGLWERWIDPASAASPDSCTILTTAAGPALTSIHDRQPVILSPDAFTTWLSRDTDPAALAPLLASYPQDGAYGPLVSYPVSTAVNDVGRDEPALRQPLAAGAAPQMTLF